MVIARVLLVSQGTGAAMAWGRERLPDNPPRTAPTTAHRYPTGSPTPTPWSTLAPPSTGPPTSPSATASWPARSPTAATPWPTPCPPGHARSAIRRRPAPRAAATPGPPPQPSWNCGAPATPSPAHPDWARAPADPNDAAAWDDLDAWVRALTARRRPVHLPPPDAPASVMIEAALSHLDAPPPAGSLPDHPALRDPLGIAPQSYGTPEARLPGAPWLPYSPASPCPSPGWRRSPPPARTTRTARLHPAADRHRRLPPPPPPCRPRRARPASGGPGRRGMEPPHRRHGPVHPRPRPTPPGTDSGPHHSRTRRPTAAHLATAPATPGRNTQARTGLPGTLKASAWRWAVRQVSTTGVGSPIVGPLLPLPMDRTYGVRAYIFRTHSVRRWQGAQPEGALCGVEQVGGGIGGPAVCRCRLVGGGVHEGQVDLVAVGRPVLVFQTQAATAPSGSWPVSRPTAWARERSHRAGRSSAARILWRVVGPLPPGEPLFPFPHT
ncbi:hypothetical protein SAMN05216533_8480 [Streptomyces sp. Ag109_O5-10]|nr:hypothetical protein SAMN05216533_8480 [Streptomyces sp. Ag109_O5-10]